MTIRYTSADRLETGVPLGGLGCGSLQVFTDGTRGEFTGLNNWERPLGQLHRLRSGSGEDYRLANPFAIFVQDGTRTVARLLQTQPIAGLPTVAGLRFECDFPIVRLSVSDPEVPLEVSATIFSGYLPRRYKESGVPGVVYRWQFHNPHERPLVLSLLACAINPVGAWNVSRYNVLRRRNGLIGITFHRRHPRPGDERQGTVALMTEASASGRRLLGQARRTVTYCASWSYAGDYFSGAQELRRIRVWESFARDGRLSNDRTRREAFGEFDEPMGALAVRVTLPPGGTAEVPITYTWHMPAHYLGHRYARYFTSAWDVGSYLHRAQGTLLLRTREWQQVIKSGPWPEWLSDGLINTLCVYSAASWWTGRAQFAVYENPIKWPLMDSLDVRYYGTLALALLFPKLERSTLELFRRAQRPDGRIPHDLGKGQINCPSDGTTAGVPWKDLSTKYALMVYRDWLWSGDQTWIRGFYPSVKRAMRWQLTRDRDGDGLPENEGRDSTYDLWDFFGVGSYTAGIHLAALRATERLARAAGDPAFARVCREQFAAGAASFEARLWTGSYYRAAAGRGGARYEACVAGQLNGQWYAHLLGLGYLVSRKRVNEAVLTMLRLNARASEFGAVNAVFPDGTVDESSLHSGNVWAGETYALAALAIYEGFIEEGLAIAQRMWRVFADLAKRPWSQTDVVGARDGRPGDGELYIRNLAIWAIPFALAHRDVRAAAVLRGLASELPARAERATRTGYWLPAGEALSVIQQE